MDYIQVDEYLKNCNDSEYQPYLNLQLIMLSLRKK